MSDSFDNINNDNTITNNESPNNQVQSGNTLPTPEIEYQGVTFANVRAALTAMYFLRKDMPPAEFMRAQQYVLPMQHNFVNPINPGSQDTWIQFWINEDDRHTQDYNYDDVNQTIKSVSITVRFLGRKAELWAKAFHHLTKRKSVARYFIEYCNADMFEYVSPIVPQNVDYFGAGNTTVAFDISFSLVYVEYMELNWEPLEFINMGPGEIIKGGKV